MRICNTTKMHPCSRPYVAHDLSDDGCCDGSIRVPGHDAHDRHLPPPHSTMTESPSRRAGYRPGATPRSSNWRVSPGPPTLADTTRPSWRTTDSRHGPSSSGMMVRVLSRWLYCTRTRRIPRCVTCCAAPTFRRTPLSVTLTRAGLVRAVRLYGNSSSTILYVWTGPDRASLCSSPRRTGLVPRVDVPLVVAKITVMTLPPLVHPGSTPLPRHVQAARTARRRAALRPGGRRPNRCRLARRA